MIGIEFGEYSKLTTRAELWTLVGDSLFWIGKCILSHSLQERISFPIPQSDFGGFLPSYKARGI